MSHEISEELRLIDEEGQDGTDLGLGGVGVIGCFQLRLVVYPIIYHGFIHPRW